MSFVRFGVRSYFLVDSTTYGPRAGKFAQAAKTFKDSSAKCSAASPSAQKFFVEIVGPVVALVEENFGTEVIGPFESAAAGFEVRL